MREFISFAVGLVSGILGSIIGNYIYEVWLK